jgi:hypothetical protein
MNILEKSHHLTVLAAFLTVAFFASIFAGPRRSSASPALQHESVKAVVLRADGVAPPPPPPSPRTTDRGTTVSASVA